MAALSSVWLAAAVASTATSIYSAQKQEKQAKSAAAQAQANALKQEQAAQQDFNRANQKNPDTLAILDAATQSGRAGASGTMLTGPQGADPGMLGKTTLLGG